MKDGLYEGEGKLTTAIGEIYNGTFEAGIFKEGIIHKKNGEVYSGLFSNG